MENDACRRILSVRDTRGDARLAAMNSAAVQDVMLHAFPGRGSDAGTALARRVGVVLTRWYWLSAAASMAG